MGISIYRTMFHRMPNPAMMLDKDFVFQAVNDAYCQAVQRDSSELLDKYIFDVFPNTPERVAAISESFRKTFSGETVGLDPRVHKLRLADRSLEDRLWQVTQFRVLCEETGGVYLVQRSVDVTEREKLREQRDLVTAELNHRVRNTLAVVQSVAEHTGLTSDSIETFLKSFSGRLAAMGRNFAALSESHWQGLDFEQIVRTELAPYVGPVLDRIRMQGPQLTMSVKATKDTSMLVHELITNASKHGFLSVPDGRLEIKWWIDGDTFHVEWNESGVPGTAPPDREGFGFQLMELMPNIAVEKDFGPDGLKIRFSAHVTIVSDELVFAGA